MPVKKKAATAPASATPARKTPAKKAAAPAARPAAKKAAAPVVKKAAAPAPKKAPGSAAKKTAAPVARKAASPVAKKAVRRKLADHDLPPASSLPPAVLPPPSGKATRAAAPVPETPGTALARAIADAADMKKGENIVILDVRGLSMVTDFLVIASGSSMPHLRAIRNEISERIREDREEKPHSAQGMAESQWMLLDYGDVVAHVFLNEKRDLYALEDLWSDAPRLAWTPS